MPRVQTAVETATTDILTQAKPVTANELEKVALTACSDGSVAQLVIEALRKVGKDGVVQIVEGGTTSLTLEIEEGVQFDRGFLSHSFVTNPERQECVLEDSYILFYEQPITLMKDLLPLLEQVAKRQKPLLIVSRDVGGEALSTLVVNSQRGTLVSAAVKSPGFEDRRRAYLEDLAILTGGRAFLEEYGVPLDAVSLQDLGTAKKIIITKDTTTIVGGSGNARAIESRARQIRNELDSTYSPTMPKDCGSDWPSFGVQSLYCGLVDSRRRR